MEINSGVHLLKNYISQVPSGGLGLVISVWSEEFGLVYVAGLSISAHLSRSVIESLSGFYSLTCQFLHGHQGLGWIPSGTAMATFLQAVCMSLNSKPTRSLDYTANMQLPVSQFLLYYASPFSWNKIFNTMIFHTWTKPQLTDYHYCLRLSASVPSQYWRSTSAVPAVNFIRTSRRNSVVEYC